ncbi:MAG: DEAD/DEAH box helicase [Methanoculleus sp. SDB]|nr:MAG: DEAD/DEAH box helicase [Methanoculleus sp. SDB]
MNIIVLPQRGLYRLFFHDGRRVTAIGTVELVRTGKGYRPKQYQVKRFGTRHLKKTPTKELAGTLRESEVRLAVRDEAFESFLGDLQIPFGIVDACRMCFLEDRVTPLKKKNAIRYGKEQICEECARRELRRELGYVGGMGSLSYGHLEHLLDLYRDLDRVLGMVQPDRVDAGTTLFDLIEAHPVQKTSKLADLPLPGVFIRAAGVESLMPAQQLSVDAGLLTGRDLLVVAATASGKTFIGEMAGIKGMLEGRGQVLFLVPLVALANQKYQRFRERYGEFARVSLHVGVSRLNLPETRIAADRDLRASIVVATYEGIDHAIRCGKRLGRIGTIVIDEVQMLEDEERGHRLDGLISRLKYIAPEAQYLYLSATIGLPGLLAKKLNAQLVRYSERPVPLERHLIFLERNQKIPTIKKLTTAEYRQRSSRGYRGQTIVFTNSRARCHVIADALGASAAPYHAGLTARERRDVEDRFLKGKLAVVVTTAALAAGVDFPASQVIFDSLAMGISWLTVQEFSQMMGRAGRPDFHDLGKVVVLAEPGGSYRRDDRHTEEEVAIMLLKGEMEEVAPVYDTEASSEEFVANAIVCHGNIEDIRRMDETMVGEVEPVLPLLLEQCLVKKAGTRIELSDLARVMAEHFIGIERLTTIRRLIGTVSEPLDIVAELECGEEGETVPKESAGKKEFGSRQRSRRG